MRNCADTQRSFATPCWLDCDATFVVGQETRYQHLLLRLQPIDAQPVNCLAANVLRKNLAAERRPRAPGNKIRLTWHGGTTAPPAPLRNV